MASTKFVSVVLIMHASEARATNKELLCSRDEFILMMASKVGHVQKLGETETWVPVSKLKRKKVSQDLSATEPTRTEESTVITRTRKVLNKKERKV